MRAILVSVLALSPVAACSSSAADDAAIAPTPAAPEGDVAPDFSQNAGDVTDGAPDASAGTADGPGAGTGTGDVGDPDGSTTAQAPTTEFDLAAQPTTPIIEPVPETGVPGIDSRDAFCQSWSRYAGSFQALALVAAIGDQANAVRLEVIASSTVVGAHEALAANLPQELEAERTSLISDLLGPFAARAQVAASRLNGAGVDLDVLQATWLDALTEAGVDEPGLTVDLPSSLDSGAIDRVVASFSAEFPSIIEDDALVTNASTPLTAEYLVENCPDGGVLAGNDDVG